MYVWRAPMDTVSHGKWKYGGKRNKLYFLFGNRLWYIPNMESIGNYSIVFVDRKSMPPKMFLSLSFSLWALAPLQIPNSLCGGPIYLIYAIFIFIWVSIFSYKAPTRGHYDRTWALDVANMRVCFMNGWMIEHNGLGITFFSVDILKDMVACWYAWVLKSPYQN